MNYRTAGNFVRVEGVGATYWITHDGARVLRGDTVDGADELQAGFIEAMVRAGS
jgi:hypothetical protein